MMKQPYNFTQSIRQNALQLTNFLGVDLTNGKSDVNLRRSPDAQNLLLSNSGSLEKRYGLKRYDIPATWIYSAVVDAQRRPRPVWNIVSHDIVLNETIVSPPYIKDTTYRILFAFVGKDTSYLEETFNIWYRFNATWTMLTGDYTVAKIIPIDDHSFVITGDAYVRPTLIVFSNLGVVTSYDLSDKTISGYENYVYTPTTQIGRSPNGLTSNVFEQINVLSQYQINTFLADGTSSAYVCSDTINTADTKVWVKVAGVWVLKTVNTHYTINTSNKTITFTAGNIPAVPTIAGEDNVKIQFVNSNKDVLTMSQSHIYGVFGLNNYKSYVFLSKGKKEYFMQKKLPLYIGINNYSEYPTQVKGYAGYGEYQTVHCEKEIFIRSSGLDASGEVIFPLKPCVSGIGVLNKETILNYADNPLWVSEFGVTTLVSGSLQYQTNPKGYYISGEQMRSRTALKYLMARFAFVYDEKYYLYNEYDGCFYVADKRYQYSEQDTGNKQQFEWFKVVFKTKGWLDGDQPMSDHFTGQCIDGLGYCLLSSTSGIYRFKIDSDTNPYTDERYDYYDYDVNNLTPAWTDNTSYVVGDFRWSGSYPYYCRKSHTVTSGDIPITNTEYWLKSISTTINIPVVAYWTTPVLNMGNISVRKTLKNLWVRLSRYAYFSAKIYYSTDGNAKYNHFFDYHTTDFSRNNFTDDTDPVVSVSNRAERKFMSIQFKVESDDQYPFGLLEILAKYTINNQYKG